MTKSKSNTPTSEDINEFANMTYREFMNELNKFYKQGYIDALNEVLEIIDKNLREVETDIDYEFRNYYISAVKDIKKQIEEIK